MKKLIVSLITLITIFSANNVSATECVGETHKGEIVKVYIKVIGTMGYANLANVQILKNDAVIREYDIEQNNIAMYYEKALTDNLSKIFVGMNAYPLSNYQVRIYYKGKNYDSTELVKELKNPKRKRIKNVSMLVWKGSNFNYDQNYSFKDVLCSADFDV